jgi:hypothetical protein
MINPGAATRAAASTSIGKSSGPLTRDSNHHAAEKGIAETAIRHVRVWDGADLMI